MKNGNIGFIKAVINQDLRKAMATSQRGFRMKDTASCGGSDPRSKNIMVLAC